MQYNIVIPYTDFVAIDGDLKNKVTNSVNTVKINYGSIIDKCAENSNVPKELLYSLVLALSNGKNNTAFRSNDQLIRSGLFSLSQKTAKIILCTEMFYKRLNPAEMNLLSSNDPAIASYLTAEKGTKSFNQHWSSDFNIGVDKISDTKYPFNLLNPNVSIQLGAIWLGMVWDAYSKQTTNPLDKVIITMLLPYNGWLAGNSFCKNKSWSIDYTKPQYVKTLPRPSSPLRGDNVINPNGGYVVDSLRSILAKGGIIDDLA